MSTRTMGIALAAICVMMCAGSCRARSPAPSEERASQENGRVAPGAAAGVTSGRSHARVPESVPGDAGAGDAGAGEPDFAAPDDVDARDDLVDIRAIDPSIALDIRYARADNFTGVAVYPVARCLLRRAVAKRLARVQAALQARDLSLLLWDCYRPFSIQERFWQLVPDPRYVARPSRQGARLIQGSRHNRGAAVDITLIAADGTRLQMPTEYDDFTSRAHRRNDPDDEPWRRSAILEEAMVAEGFLPMSSEWWHFDSPDWRSYPLEDVPLSAP